MIRINRIGLKQFISQKIDFGQVPFIKKVSILTCRFVYYLYKNFFIKDGCLIRASALTYVTMLSIVPILAVMFSLIKGLGFKPETYQVILNRIMPGQETAGQKIIEFINNVNAAKLGVAGASILILSVILVMGNIEKSFNKIWKTESSRSFFRKITDYIGVLVICPVFITLSMSFNALVKFSGFFKSFFFYEKLISVHFFLWPYLSVWLAFLFIYIFIPNVKVKIVPALIGSLVASVLWQYAQSSYMNYQIALKNYQIIYGSLAQLPILLIWIYISWIILLFGGEITFISQNFKLFNKDLLYREYNISDKLKIAVLSAYYIVDRFKRGSGVPFKIKYIKDKINVPENVIEDVLGKLVPDILVKRNNDESEVEYFLKMSPEKINFKLVFKTILEYPESSEENFDIDNILGKLNYFDTMKNVYNILKEEVVYR